MALNEYADLSWAEFQRVKLGLNPDLIKPRPLSASNELFMYEGTPLEEKMDWREKGAVTPVKNQARINQPDLQLPMVAPGAP